MVKDVGKGAFNLRFTEYVTLFQDQEFIDILCDLSQKRIEVMDRAGLDIQVLSFSSPGIDEFEPDYDLAGTMARELNDILFEATQHHPSRFMGFAALSPYNVPQSVRELERAINDLGLVGWLADSNFGQDNYLDDKQYWPLLEAAEGLDIPIYLHPTAPLMKEYGKYGSPLQARHWDSNLTLRFVCYV